MMKPYVWTSFLNLGPVVHSWASELSGSSTWSSRDVGAGGAGACCQQLVTDDWYIMQLKHQVPLRVVGIGRGCGKPSCFGGDSFQPAIVYLGFSKYLIGLISAKMRLVKPY